MEKIQAGQEWRTSNGSTVKIQRIAENKNSLAGSTQAAYFMFKGHEVGVWVDGKWPGKGGSSLHYDYELVELLSGPETRKRQVQLSLF